MRAASSVPDKLLALADDVIDVRASTKLLLSLAIFAGSGDRLFGGHDFLLCGIPR